MCARILSNGLPEVIKTWTDPKSGAPVKCRADWDNENMGIIADLKTTDDASPKGFAKSCRKWTYDKQAAVYSDGMKRDNFVFMAVEKNAPYAVGVYFAGADMIEAGREKRDKNLNTYVEALSTGIWKGYSEDIVPVEW
jgi:exodeoxyribonuclease VIII